LKLGGGGRRKGDAAAKGNGKAVHLTEQRDATGPINKAKKRTSREGG